MVEASPSRELELAASSDLTKSPTNQMTQLGSPPQPATISPTAVLNKYKLCMSNLITHKVLRGQRFVPTTPYFVDVLVQFYPRRVLPPLLRCINCNT